MGTIVSVINLSDGAVADAEVLRVIRAVNRQLREDFEPSWKFGGELRLEGKTGKSKRFDAADMRGDAVLYVRGVTRIREAEGFHERHFSGIPYGCVYHDLSKKLHEDWSVTLSHEALELVADPQANLLVQGPHPTEPKRDVFHWYEVCDAVQAETYAIDGVSVSNFVLPLYFTSSHERGGRNDFLGTRRRGQMLKSFSVNPGGYIGFFDPTIGKRGDHDTYELPDDVLAAARLSTKQGAGSGRGVMRQRRSSRFLRRQRKV